MSSMFSELYLVSSNEKSNKFYLNEDISQIKMKSTFVVPKLKPQLADHQKLSKIEETKFTIPFYPSLVDEAKDSSIDISCKFYILLGVEVYL